MRKNKLFMTFMSVIALMMGLLQSSTSYAAESAIKIAEDVIKLNIGETTVITVDYTKLGETFDDIAVISSDNSIAAASIADLGNGTASLGLAGVGLGTASVAVYSISNPAIADYTVIQSGLATGNTIINQTNGTSLTAIYNDRIINYPAILTGRNNAQIAVTGLILEREKGIDCLKVSGELLSKDSQFPGMTAFYANYYDAAGGLIKRQAVYTRDPQANTHMELKWYIPDGCTQIIIE